MKDYFKNQIKLFLNSFKEFDTRTLFIILYDMIFFLISISSIYILVRVFSNKALAINNLPIQQITVSQELARSMLAEFKSFLLFLIIAPLIVSFIIFVSMSILKILIWFNIARKTITAQEIIKFIGIRALWLLISIGITILLTPLFLLAYFAAQASSFNLLFIVGAILFFIFVFFNNIKTIMYIKYTETKSLSIIKSSFLLGIKKAHYFIIPCIIIGVIFILFFNSYFYVFKFFFERFIPVDGESIKTMFFYLIIPMASLFAWFRIYFYNVVKDIEH